MEATARTLFKLSQDFDNQEEARRREEYYIRLKQKDNTISEMGNTIKEMGATIKELQAEIERLKKH